MDPDVSMQRSASSRRVKVFYKSVEGENTTSPPNAGVQLPVDDAPYRRRTVYSGTWLRYKNSQVSIKFGEVTGLSLKLYLSSL
jgi:hypothetical protein